jgi:hypothetical protein
MAENFDLDIFTTTAATANGGEFTNLETGAYDGICVGVTVRNFKKFQSEELEKKFQFVFQIVDGDKKHYLRTLPYRNVINDKSNLFLFLSGWTGLTLEQLSGGFDLTKLVGAKAQIVVGEQERDGRKYNNIANVIKTKKNSTVAYVKDDKAPAFLAKDVLAAKWIDNIAFAEQKQQPQADVKMTDEDLIKAAEIAKQTDMDEKLPF